MRNHLGQYECRLCLTLHNNEGNYLAHTQVHPIQHQKQHHSCTLAILQFMFLVVVQQGTSYMVRMHTQGKRHQQNLAKRAAREAAEKPALPQPNRRATTRQTVKIGRPGYKVTKQYDPETMQRSLLFQVA